MQKQFQIQDELGQKVRPRFSLFKPVAYCTGMRKHSLSYSAQLILCRTALKEEIENFPHYREAKRLFKAVLIQKEVENLFGYLTF